MKKKSRLVYLMLFTIFFNGCAGSRGNLKKIKTDKAIGIFSYSIIDGQGEDITDSCIIRYTFGTDEHTPAYKIKDTPHFLEFKETIKVEYIYCLINLLTYKYELNDFEFKVSNRNAYNFGKYYFEYDYKASYEDTNFYKVARKCVKEDRVDSECKNSSKTWLNEGKVTLIKVDKGVKSDLNKHYPYNNKKQVFYNSLKPSNVFLKKD